MIECRKFLIGLAVLYAAAALVTQSHNLIYTTAGAAARAALDKTRTTPIVLWFSGQSGSKRENGNVEDVHRTGEH